MTDTTPLAVVTGASSGIGFELATLFAQNGFDLLVNAEDAGLDRAAEQLRTHGALVHPVQADLGTSDGVEQLYAAITATGRSCLADRHELLRPGGHAGDEGQPGLEGRPGAGRPAGL